MSSQSVRAAGVLLVVLPTVVYGGVSILSLMTRRKPFYTDNPLRQRLWRAGHAHAGVFLVLSLVILLYVDQAKLPSGLATFVRSAAPTAAILVPAAFFLSVLKPDAKKPNAFINVAYAGAIVLALGVASLGIGLLRAA